MKRLDDAQLVDPRLQKNRAQVFFGATVTYANMRDEENTVRIVGIDEADPGRGDVSWTSPIARALLKARIGDTVQVRRVSQQAQDNVAAGYNALVRGDHDMALGFYDRALQQEPRSVLAQLGRGAALQKLGRLDEARSAYERVLKIDPNNREALTNLTAIVAEREPGEALRRLQELEREYPSFSPIKAQIGLVYARLGSFEPALDYLRRAVSLTPDAPMYHYNLALVLDRLNRPQQAIASYERVLSAAALGRLGPEVPTVDIERRVRYLRTK